MIINRRPSKIKDDNKQKNTLKNKSSFTNQMHGVSISNNQSQLIMEKIEPRKGHQIDRYEGPVNPITNLRDGKGKYHYSNTYFQFEGIYSNGKKQGPGKLKLGNGTVIEGNFEDDELIGPAKISYADGSIYQGNLQYGQKSGQGKYTSQTYSYKGNYKNNMKHGKGTLKTATQTIIGQFKNDKLNGQSIERNSYNYSYVGGYVDGIKCGSGKQISTWIGNNYEYTGEFKNGKFQGNGEFISRTHSDYQYKGEFIQGKPKLYPNQFRISTANNPIAKSPTEESTAPQKQSFKVVASSTALQYELQSQNQMWFTIQCCYQGPQELDPIQPTPEDIEKMTKDWQNQNKKNKNPPPMPDFNKPRMIKPELVIVQQESNRPIQIKLIKVQDNNGQEKQVEMKIDYRKQIKQKRIQNQEIKAEQAKKNEEEGAKKGGKGPAKGGQPQLKVLAYVQSPKNQDKVLKILSNKGVASVQNFQLPDDFPPGNYWLHTQSSFAQFGEIEKSKIQLSVKPKNVGKKK